MIKISFLNILMDKYKNIYKHYEECFDNAYKKAKNNQAVYIAREGCRRLFMNNATDKDKAYGKCLLNLSKEIQIEFAGHIGTRGCIQLHLREEKVKAYGKCLVDLSKDIQTRAAGQIGLRGCLKVNEKKR